MVNSEWNIALDTLYRLAEGYHICTNALQKNDFGSWLMGLHHLHLQLGVFMTDKEQEKAIELLDKAKKYRGKGIDSNLTTFMITTQYFQRIAHKNGLYIKEGEDTMKHGG